MVDFRFTAGGLPTHVKYHYDGDGRRIQKEVVGGRTTTYVYNAAGQLVAEYAGTVPPALRYLTPDHLGSTRVVTAANQAQNEGVLTRHDYLPFGQEIEPNRGNRSSVSGYTASLADGPTQKFTGKERDEESRLDYFNARYFSGAGGRFTSVDPENAGASPADPQSWNGYTYARNNPLLYVDPDGRYFIVCTVDGDCTSYAIDYDFYNFLDEGKLQYDPERDEDGNPLPSNIYSVDEEGNRTLYGRAIHFNTEPGLEPTGLVEELVGGGFLKALLRPFLGKLGGRLLAQAGSDVLSTGLSRSVTKKLGGLLTDRRITASTTVRNAIKKRGGNQSTVRQVSNKYLDRTLAETAKDANNGNVEAETAIKLVKGAAKYAGD